MQIHVVSLYLSFFISIVSNTKENVNLFSFFSIVQIQQSFLLKLYKNEIFEEKGLTCTMKKYIIESQFWIRLFSGYLLFFKNMK